MPPDDLLALTIAHREPLTSDIELFRLAAEAGRLLPAYDPGAHVAVQTPSGAMRRYSLISDPSDLSCYEIAVKHEPNGRGGSASLHRQAHVNDRIFVQAPANDFELVAAPAYLFIAGGIGITPIWSMIQSLRARGHGQWQLVYCTRSASHTPFADALRQMIGDEQIVIHHDNGEPDAAYDFWPLLETPDERHVYCCGPAALMEDVAAMTGHWPLPSIHTEDFSPVQAVRADDKPFTVRVAGSDGVLSVGADQTLLEALRAAGFDMRSSCESGTCGTCRVHWHGEAQIDHRDLFLMPDERQNCLMACVSRVIDGDIELVLPQP